MSIFEKIKSAFRSKPKVAPPTDAEVAQALRAAGITPRETKSGYNVYEGSGGALAGTTGVLHGYKERVKIDDEEPK